MAIQIRPIQADELDAFQHAMSVPFSFDPDDDNKRDFAELFELSRLRAAFEGDAIVGRDGRFPNPKS